jgi:hypothetical protein
MRKICLSLMAIVFFVSCQETLSDTAKASIEKEIAEITDVTFSYFNESDTANVYLSYSDDFVALSTGELIIVPEEWEEYKAQGKEALPTRAPVTLKITESRIDVLSTTVVNHHFIFNSKTVLAEDMSFETSAACTYTYVLEEDTWKIRNAHVSYPPEQFRAVEGDTLFLAFLDVKAESKEEFERLSHEMLFDRISEADQTAEFISTKTRMMHPSEANEDGTYTYLIMFDPMYSGEYNFTTSNLYSKIYGEEKGKELDDQLAETLAGAQKSYKLIQSKK